MSSSPLFGLASIIIIIYRRKECSVVYEDRLTD